MDTLYRDYILDHFRNPRNSGTLEDADVSNEEDNPLCGDVIRVDLKLEGEHIEAARFKGRGCAISQASASMLMEMVEGMSLEEIKQLDRADILENLGVSIGPARQKCALLALRVLRNGLATARGDGFASRED